MKYKVIAWSALTLGGLMMVAGAVGYLVQLTVSDWLGNAHAWNDVLRNWQGTVFGWIGVFGFSTVLCACFCLIFSGTVRRHCWVSTSLASVGLSAMGALGLVSGINVAFLSPTKNPIAFPAYFSLACFCLAVFLGMIALYTCLRSKRWSFWGSLMDVLTSIIFLPGFWWFWLWISNGLA